MEINNNQHTNLLRDMAKKEEEENRGGKNITKPAYRSRETWRAPQ